MNQDLSIFTLVLQASLVVQIVMAGLLLVSLASWTRDLRQALRAAQACAPRNDDFEREFWAGKQPERPVRRAPRRRPTASPMERIFASRHARVPEAARAPRRRRRHAARRRAPRDARELPARARRGRVATCRFLASVGSVSPYVGLFGTVWGIMHAFIGLSNLQQVTLATVAPGIAEALVATAIGLFAAIPAVIAYNRFARDIDRIAIQLETFIEEFSNILQRNARPARRARAPRRRASAPPDSSHGLPSCRRHAARAGARSTRSTWCPFIDVMLVLLIIFMVTAPLITTGLVDLPTRRQEPASGPSTWSRSSSAPTRRCALRIDGKDRGRRAAAGAARRRACSRRRPATRDTPVVISADRNVKYEAVVKVMDTLQRAGVQRVGLSVKNSGG